MVRQLRRCAFEPQAFDTRNVARLVCRRPEGGRAVMRHEVWKGRASSGIPKNVSGSIKREHVAAFDVCQGSPCQSHNPGIVTIGRQCSIRSPPPNRVGATSTPSNGSSNGISGFSPLRKAQQKLGRQIRDENLLYRSPLGSLAPQQVFGAFVRDAGLSARWFLFRA